MRNKKHQVAEKIKKLIALQSATKVTSQRIQEATEKSSKTAQELSVGLEPAVIDDYTEQKSLLFRYITGLVQNLKVSKELGPIIPTPENISR